MMIARLRGTPTPIRQIRADVPVHIEKALAKSMATNPDDRFATALELGTALASGEGGGDAGGGGLFGKLKGKFT
jgi:hypothetical protein